MNRQKMKLYSGLLVILVAALLAVGCGDDDNSNTPTSKNQNNGNAGDNDNDNNADVPGSNNSSPNENNNGDNGPEGMDSTRQVLQNIGENVVLDTYRDFAEQTGVLVDATEAYKNNSGAEERTQVQGAWRDTMSLWQQAEMFQFGPAGASDAVEAGADLRDEIYSWPLVNRCRVDQELVDGAYSNVDAFASERIIVRGLDAMEYLLFAEGDENACAPNSGINREGTWNQVKDEIRQRRADYAHTLAILLERDAEALRDSWEPGSGNFLATFTSAGEGSEVYPNTRVALNALSDAIFYLDTEVKDSKLAEPINFSGNTCPEEACLEFLESEKAHHSREAIEGNLLAFQKVFLGASPDQDAPGFDDLLREANAGELADEMTHDVEAAITHVQDMDGSLADNIEDNPEEARALYDAVKKLTDNLKGRFVEVLELQLPQRAEGDND